MTVILAIKFRVRLPWVAVLLVEFGFLSVAILFTFVPLYPIPFRLLDEKEQYDRLDVIRVKVCCDTKD